MGNGRGGCHIRALRSVARRRLRGRPSSGLAEGLIPLHLICGHFHGKAPISVDTEFPSPIRGPSGKSLFVFGLKQQRILVFRTCASPSAEGQE